MSEEKKNFPSIEGMKPGDIFQQNEVLRVEKGNELEFTIGDYFIAAWIPSSKRENGSIKKVIEGLIEVLEAEDV